VIASASAGAPIGEGPGEVDTHEKVASEAGAVASAPEFLSSITPPSEKGGGDVPDQGVSTVPPAPEWPLDAPQSGPVAAAGNRQSAIGSEASSTDEGTTAESPVRFKVEYPLMAAAIAAWAARNEGRKLSELTVSVRIAAKRDGFRRCGLAHPKAATEHPIGRFPPAELEMLLAEPMLTVELV